MLLDYLGKKFRFHLLSGSYIYSAGRTEVKMLLFSFKEYFRLNKFTVNNRFLINCIFFLLFQTLEIFPADMEVNAFLYIIY